MGLSQAELARRVGMSQPSINHLIRKGAQGSKHLHVIARELETTPEYLTGVTDDPDAGFVPTPSASVVAAEMGMVQVRQVDLAIGMGATYLDQPTEEMQHLFPREWLNIYTRAPAEKLLIVKGSGDSMVPTMHDNDLLLIDTTQSMPRLTDQVWAVSYCGLGSVKRLRPTNDGGWLLLSDNPAISPITAYDGELHVLGRVVAFFRKM
jgi:phage repressor protein C with HTH and peptisase S24 domain